MASWRLLAAEVVSFYIAFYVILLGIFIA